MKPRWIGLAASLVAPLAAAQATIYKQVDAGGRVTYSNRPMSGAVIVELEPLSTFPGSPKPTTAPVPSAAQTSGTPSAAPRATPNTPVAIVTPLPATAPSGASPTSARTDERRKGLEEAIREEETALAQTRQSLLQEQRNPVLIAAVRQAQSAVEVSASQQAEMRASIDRASGRIRGLQSTVAEHEKKIEALKKELDGLKP
jgi:hypothetical protein